MIAILQIFTALLGWILLAVFRMPALFCARLLTIQELTEGPDYTEWLRKTKTLVSLRQEVLADIFSLVVDLIIWHLERIVHNSEYVHSTENALGRSTNEFIMLGIEALSSPDIK